MICCLPPAHLLFIFPSEYVHGEPSLPVSIEHYIPSKLSLASVVIVERVSIVSLLSSVIRMRLGLGLCLSMLTHHLYYKLPRPRCSCSTLWYGRLAVAIDVLCSSVSFYPGAGQKCVIRYVFKTKAFNLCRI
jgi:hypothetical protein